MKYFLTCILLLILSSGLMADNVNLFQYDKIELESKIYRLNQLETYVDGHQGITLKELQNEQNELSEKLVNTFVLIDEDPVKELSFIHGYLIGIGGCLMLSALYYSISLVGS